MTYTNFAVRSLLNAYRTEDNWYLLGDAHTSQNHTLKQLTLYQLKN